VAAPLSVAFQPADFTFTQHFFLHLPEEKVFVQTKPIFLWSFHKILFEHFVSPNAP
jgi:hypothetical protein